MIISLLGYMGCGKTHISKKLNEKFNYKLIDLDEEIMRKNQKTISQIFSDRGEIFFRKEEKRVLEEILDQKESLILSLGGGTPAYYDNMKLINERSISIYLRANISTLTARLLSEKEQRPLIAHLNEENLAEYIAKHLFERNHFYNKAQFTVAVDGKTDGEITTEIERLITGIL